MSNVQLANMSVFGFGKLMDHEDEDEDGQKGLRYAPQKEKSVRRKTIRK